MIEFNGWWYPVDDGKLKGWHHSRPLPTIYDHVKDFSCAIDGGAFVGHWSKAFLEHFDRVIAIELAPDSTECLRKNVPKAEAYCGCLSDRHERVGYIGDKNPLSAIRCVDPGDDVETILIDDMNIPSLGLVKLDLQGYEYFALRGGEKTIRNLKPAVLIERQASRNTERYGIKDNQCDALLRSWGAGFAGKIGADMMYTWT